MKNAIAIQDFRTAQEHWFAGSTPEVEPLEEADWYIPQGVLKGVLAIEEAIKLRKVAGHFESGILSAILRLTGGMPISVGFSDINKETGMTLRDPEIIGLWDKNKREIVKIEGRDLTKEAYNIFRKLETDLHLRESTTTKEGKVNSSEQRG